VVDWSAQVLSHTYLFAFIPFFATWIRHGSMRTAMAIKICIGVE
jgi:hypothetical protein